MLTYGNNRGLVLGDAVTAERGRGLNLDVLSSVLIGLAAPMLVVLLIDPAALRHTRVVIALLLTTIFFISVILFAHSLLLPGHVRAVSFDPISRTVKLIRDGLFAANDLDIPFSLIRALRIEPASDGMKALLVMSTRETIILPVGTTEGHLATIRNQFTLSQRTGPRQPYVDPVDGRTSHIAACEQ